MGLLPIMTLPSEPASAWRWYHVAYGSPRSDAKLFNRSGSASVVLGGQSVRIELRTAGTEEVSTFAGRLNGKHLSGKLTNFFPSGDEAREGEYREKQVSNCRWRQFSIWPEYPDGSVTIVSRIDGSCQ